MCDQYEKSVLKWLDLIEKRNKVQIIKQIDKRI